MAFEMVSQSPCITSTMSIRSNLSPVFITFNDPYQMKDDRVREKVKSFTSKHNAQQHKQMIKARTTYQFVHDNPISFTNRTTPKIERTTSNRKTAANTPKKSGIRSTAMTDDELAERAIKAVLSPSRITELERVRIDYLDAYPKEHARRLHHLIDFCGFSISTERAEMS